SAAAPSTRPAPQPRRRTGSPRPRASGSHRVRCIPGWRTTWCSRSARSRDRRVPSDRGPRYACGQVGFGGSELATRLLVETELVADGIRKRCKSAHVGTNGGTRSQHATACGLNLLQGFRNTVNHDVDARSLVRRPIAFLDPGAAHTSGIVERQVSVTPLPDLPAEDPRVEVRRLLCLVRWNLEIADLAVGH